MRILIIAPNWLGDLIIAQSLVKFLKLANPEVSIALAAPKSIASIAHRITEVDQVIAVDIQSRKFALYQRMVLSQQIKRKFDWAIILPITFKSALAPYFAGVKRRTGFLGEFRYELINDIIKKEHKLGKKKGLTQQAIYLSLIGIDLKKLSANQKKLITPQLKTNLSNQNQLIEKFNISTKKPIVALAMGSNYGKAKQWPIESFRKLALLSIEQGFQILLLGSKSESELAEQFFADEMIEAGQVKSKKTIDTANVINAIGKTSLEDSVDLLALCNHLVTNDSGLMHVGSALGIGIIAIYGSSSPEFTPPLVRDNNQIKIFQSDLDCSPCFDRICRFSHTNCLKQTTAEAVFNALHIKTND